MESIEKCDRTKGYEPRVINWGNKQGPFVWIPLGSPPPLELKMFTSSSYMEVASHVRVSWPTSGEKGEGRSGSPSSTCHFSKSFSLKFSICQGARFWDSVFWTPSTQNKSILQITLSQLYFRIIEHSEKNMQILIKRKEESFS